MILFNACIYTMNNDQKKAEVMVIKDGKILDIGGKELLDRYTCEPSKRRDLGGQFVYPGLIDAHCHFYGYAKTALTAQLDNTKSWEEVLDSVQHFASVHDSKWVLGRGWDQNQWTNKEFPDNKKLNEWFPDRPVMLKRIDGHAAICNDAALRLSGIHADSKIAGGEIVLKNGQLSGVLIDNAVDLVEKVVAGDDKDALIKSLQNTEKKCFSLGLTTLADAGLGLKECLFLDSLSRAGTLNMFLYLMLNPDADAYQFAKDKGIYETSGVRIGSFKLYSDGALGSRGAKLKKDYCDRHGHSGYLIHSPVYFDSLLNLYYKNTSYQVNTHCIGDSANSLILEAYSKVLKKNDDRRWRIEHAQILDLNDIKKFGQYGIIPSVQPTHATSDGLWAVDRLCENRLKGAYAYQTLLGENDYLALGTDFPVEYIEPIYTFYSAVFRMSASNGVKTAFLPEEKLSPEQALLGMTLWAAKACKLEHRKGSLEKGKDADFVVLDTDLMKATAPEVLKTSVLLTYSSGILRYSKK